MKAFGLPESAKKRGIITAETIDPRDMKSNRETVKIKRIRPIRQETGEMAR